MKEIESIDNHILKKDVKEDVAAEVAETSKQPDVHLSDFAIYKNMTFLCLAFVINFTATNSLGILQSSINSDAGLGTASMSVNFAAVVFSSMFLSTFIIKKFDCKWSMVVSILGCSVGIAANFGSSWASMIPTAIIQGLTLGVVWSANSTYITRMAKSYALHHKMSVEGINNAFFGIFYTCFSTTQIWGNLMSSKLLAPHGNGTAHIFSAARLEVCGANYCNEDLNALDLIGANGSRINSTEEIISTSKPNHQLQVLLWAYLAMSLFSSILLAVTITDIPKIEEDVANQASGIKLLVATFGRLKDKLQILLLPISIFRGLGEAFLSADYTKAYVACALGVHTIGLIAICFGTVTAICSLTYGFAVKSVGRLPVFIFAAVANFTSIFLMLYLHLSPDNPAATYILPPLWGLGDACWQSQVNALYGFLFYEDMEAAFSLYRLADSVGFIIGLAWNYYVCVRVKLWVCFALLCLGLIGYFSVEVLLKFQKGEIELNSNDRQENIKVEILNFKKVGESRHSASNLIK